MQQSSGFIEINSECGKSITVPFQATVLQGELEYNASSLGFFVKADNVPPRNFRYLLLLLSHQRDICIDSCFRFSVFGTISRRQ